MRTKSTELTVAFRNFARSPKNGTHMNGVFAACACAFLFIACATWTVFQE